MSYTSITFVFNKEMQTQTNRQTLNIEPRTKYHICFSLSLSFLFSPDLFVTFVRYKLRQGKKYKNADSSLNPWRLIDC